MSANPSDVLESFVRIAFLSLALAAKLSSVTSVAELHLLIIKHARHTKKGAHPRTDVPLVKVRLEVQLQAELDVTREVRAVQRAE